MPSSNRITVILTLFGSLMFSASLAAREKHGAHEHGSAKMSIAVDQASVQISFEVPSDSMFGFEHPALAEADQKTVSEAMKALREKGLELFVFAAEKNCKVTSARVKAKQEDDMLAAKTASNAKVPKKPAVPSDVHADVDADYRFTCGSSLAGSTLRLGLMTLFPKLKKIEVQLLSGDKQSGQKVVSAADAISL